MSRKKMFYYIMQNGIAIDECNLHPEQSDSIYYLSDAEMQNIVNEIISNAKEKICIAAEENKSKALPGDKINACGLSVIIEKILYQDCIDNSFDIEFIDNKGNYRHWKQQEDGGIISRWNGRNYSKISK